MVKTSKFPSYTLQDQIFLKVRRVENNQRKPLAASLTHQNCNWFWLKSVTWLWQHQEPGGLQTALRGLIVSSL